MSYGEFYKLKYRVRLNINVIVLGILIEKKNNLIRIFWNNFNFWELFYVDIVVVVFLCYFYF